MYPIMTSCVRRGTTNLGPVARLDFPIVWYRMVSYDMYYGLASVSTRARVTILYFYYVIASESARALSTQAQLYYGIASAEHASDLP